MTGLFKVIH